MNLPSHDPVDAVAAAPARQTRLRALMFTGTTLETTLVPLAAADPKIPPYVGE